MGGRVPLLGGGAHLKARQWTDTVQTPFGTRAAAIIDPITQSREAGTLTYDQVTAAQEALETEIADLDYKATEFRIQGNDEDTVIRQMYEKLDPIIAGWREGLKSDAEKLAPKMDIGDVPTLESMLAGYGQTPTGRAAAAAAQQRKRTAGSGRLATILTGYKGTTGTTATPTAAKGY